MTESTGYGTTDVREKSSTSTDEARRSRAATWRLKNWRLRTKLFAVLAIPTICALALGGLRVYTDLDEAEGLAQLANQVRLEDAVGDLVQQLQRERDLSADYVASGRRVERIVLDRQLKRVNDAQAELDDRISELSGDLDPVVAERYRRASDQLARLNSLRTAVIDTSYPSEAVLRTYSESVESLLDLGEQAIADIDDPVLVRLHLATNAIARIKEQESRKRGILLDVFQRQQFIGDQERQLLAADAELDAARNDFRKSATAEQARIYDDTVIGLVVDNAHDMQEAALSRVQTGNDDFSALSPKDWDIASTLTVNLTRDVESLLLEQLQTDSDDKAAAARARAFQDSALVLGALALALVMALFVARSILGPLRILRRTALEVADHGLPDAVERILADPNPQEASKGAIAPVPVHTREEVGQVARAFDAVHGEAVRLAAQQALLRDNVNAMFVNLSRRSQALVERQLNLIDRLEQDEQDPDQLASLFELDHLATRMRRNSENLLVLSGTDLSRRLTRPVPAAEVLGAAVSEVEQYARVQVGQTPELTVQGRAVNDLVHLIAELLDNATAFSDPVTKVTVRTARTRKGELAVEIHDRGVGMGDQEIVDANERLADPPDVDVAVSRRMGLYVVARLAKRHDIKVRLRANDDIEGGTTALVIVPDTLVAMPGASPQPMVQPEPTADYSHPAQRASGIAGAFTSAVPRLDDQPSFPAQPEFPVSVVQSTNGSATGSFPVFAETPQEISQPWLPVSGDELEQSGVTPLERSGVNELPEPQGSFGEPTLFTAYEDRGEDADAPYEQGFETTQFAPALGLDQGLDQGVQRNGTSDAARVQQRDDAPTERLPIYEAVLSQWFQAVGGETSASTAQAVPPAAEPQETAAPAREEKPLPTRKPKPVPAVAPTTQETVLPSRPEPAASSGSTSGSSLPKRTPESRAPETRVPEPEPEPVTPEPTAPEPVQEPVARERAEFPERAARSAESAWQSPADEGWHAAQALLSKAPESKTPAGLPKRTPKAQLVPGSAAPKPQSAQQVQRPPLPPRSPDAIRGRMSSLQQGVRRGRHALIDAYAGDQSSRQDEEQE
ncbi:sensor histidine kinase [Umezawaea beigongshangensis]|uniref:sensor histidine kinase n=1 Tax=Umezawaea beigongshangensis TaxID=2780383 RepID=UPI0027DDBDEF|nr:nitrate- and nitrite sensing domain-containing protein [Umezawaea beigongshangensis]